MLSRRQFGTVALGAAAMPLLARADSTVKGVMIGAQSYSFRDRPLDEAIKAMADVGLTYVEVWQGHLEPKKGTPEAEVKKWRTSPEAMQQVKDARKKFSDAGIQVYALNYSFRKNHTDDEVLKGMEMAQVLGTKFITASSTVDQAKRLSDLAAKQDVFVAMHNHDKNEDPNEYATPESFAKAINGNARIRLNLDIGHFTAANFDAVDYLTQHHAKIVTLHFKDRKKNHGANMPFGEGDTPIKPVLSLLRDKKWRIPAMIEYEYKGADAVAEVKKSYEYMKQALA